MFSYYMDWRLSRIQFFSLTESTLKWLYYTFDISSRIFFYIIRNSWRFIKWFSLFLKYYVFNSLSLCCTALSGTLRSLSGSYKSLKISVMMKYVFYRFLINVFYVCWKYETSEDRKYCTLKSFPLSIQFVKWFADYLVNHDLDYAFFLQKIYIDDMAKKTTEDSKGKVEYTTRPTKVYNIDAYRDPN